MNTKISLVQHHFKVCPEDTLQAPLEFKIVKVISGGEVPVFLIESLEDNQLFISKFYPSNKDETPSKYYLNEKRFTFLQHPNITTAFDA